MPNVQPIPQELTKVLEGVFSKTFLAKYAGVTTILLMLLPYALEFGKTVLGGAWNAISGRFKRKAEMKEQGPYEKEVATLREELGQIEKRITELEKPKVSPKKRVDEETIPKDRALVVRSPKFGSSGSLRI